MKNTFYKSGTETAFFCLLFAIFSICNIVNAQNQNISVTSLNGSNIDDILTQHLAGPGVVLSNGKFNNITGNVTYPQIGTFQANASGFLFNSGLLLTTGNVSVAEGPNYHEDMSDEVEIYYSDPKLQPFVNDDIYACSTLDFDFVSTSDTFSFSYIFASDEYPEFVCSQFNDIFAFLLSGPDPATGGATNFTDRNIAVIPGTVSADAPDGVYVAINTINQGVGESGYPDQEGCIDGLYSQYYIQNPMEAPGVEYDGYTVVLTAGAHIIAGETYHMHLSVGNVGDNNYDSGVFLKANSFLNPTASTHDTAVCEDSFPLSWNGAIFDEPGEKTVILTNSVGADSTVTLIVTSLPNTSETIEITIGPAELPYTINDEEYTSAGIYEQHLVNHYGCDSLLIIKLAVGCADTTVEMSKTVCSYELPILWHGSYITSEGVYSATLSTQAGCDSTINLTVSIIPIEVEIVPNTDDACSSSSVILSVFTNASNYVWSTGEQSPVIEVSTPGTYMVTATEQSCSMTAAYKLSPCEPSFLIPNSITPGKADGLNDEFFIHSVTKENVESFEIVIFNKYGNVVFHSYDINFRWDGRVNDKLYMNETYNYIINYSDKMGKRYKINGSLIVL